MTERDFVLNNIAKLMNNDYSLGHTIAELKSIYKTICENTSEESDDDFIGKDNINQFVQIEFKNIGRISEVGDTLFVCDNKLQSQHALVGSDKINFKQWFERKRGGE